MSAYMEEAEQLSPPPPALRCVVANHPYGFFPAEGDAIEAAIRLSLDSPEPVFFIHCVSEDLAMGQGAADQVRAEAGRPADPSPRPPDAPFRPRVIVQRPASTSRMSAVTILHLVTKRRCGHHPTLAAFVAAVNEAFRLIPEGASVVMPRIGCGLDCLTWDGPGGVEDIVRRAQTAAAPRTTVWALLPAYIRQGTGGGGAGVVPHFDPSITPDEWSHRFAAAKSGCAEPGCSICPHWVTAARELRPSGNVNRKGALDAAILAVLRARELGFEPHTPFVSGDKVEDGSSDPAPDSPDLTEAMESADAELRHHARPADVAGMTPDPAFTASRILADAQGLHQARAAAGRMLPASVRAMERLPADDWWEVATGVIADLSSTSLRRFVPAAGTLPPVPAFPFVVHQHGKARLCINYRPFNSFFKDSTYRLPCPKDLALAGTTREWMVKLDLRSAFRRVRIPAAAAGAIGCAVAGSLLVYDMLPFGWSFAPEIFSSTLAPVIRQIRERLAGWATLVVYVDDVAIAADTPADAVRAATLALQILRSNGFVASCKKSFLRPVRNLRFLGVVVTAGRRPAVAMTRDMTERMLEMGRCAGTTIRSPEALAEFWGLLSFVAYSVRQRLAIYRSALDPAASAALEGRLPWVGDDEAEAALADLIRRAASAVAIAWADGPHELFRGLRRQRAAMSSDASSSGGAATLVLRGAVLRQRWSWTMAESATPSAGRELLVAARSLQSWGPSLRGLAVDWICDATAATSAVQSWSSASVASLDALETIERCMSEYDIDIQSWWYSRSSPEIREVDDRSRAQYLRVPAAGVAPVAFTTDHVTSAAAACGLAGASLHHMWIPGSDVVAPAYTSHLPNGGVGQRRATTAGPRWLGPPSPASWAGQVVWAPAARSARHQVVTWLNEASREKPCAVILPIPTGADASGLSGAVDGLTVASAPLVAAGDMIKQWDTLAARWIDVRAERHWSVRLLFASPAAPADRSLSRAERLAALHASGFPPHPGPPRRRVSLATLHRRSQQGAAHAVEIDSSLGIPPHLAPQSLQRSGAATGASAIDDALRVRRPFVADAMRQAAVATASDGTDLGGWPSLDEVLAAAACDGLDQSLALAARCGWLTPNLRANPVVVSQVAAALVEIDSMVGAATETRASRVAAQMRGVAGAAGIGQEPFSTGALDALAAIWVRTRLGLPGALAVELSRRGAPAPSAPTVAADAGALAARLRRRIGSWRPDLVPATALGPLSQKLLLSRGSAAKHDASPKRVVWGWELRWGLHNNPHIPALHPEACAAILAMGGSMWRSLYIRNLRRCDAMWFGAPAGPAPPSDRSVPVTSFPSLADVSAFHRPPASVAAGAAAAPPQRRCAVFRWDGAHKTNRHAGDPSLPSTPRFGFLAADWVLAVVGPFIPATHDPTDVRPLFPDPTTPGGAAMSYEYLSAVLTALLKGLPRAEDATLHGLRLGCDAELRAHGVADELRDALGWWKRLIRRMSEHYEALDAARLAAAVALYGTLLAQALAPGLMATSAHFRGPHAPVDSLPWFSGAASRASTTSRWELSAPVQASPAGAGSADDSGVASPGGSGGGSAATAASHGRRPTKKGDERRCHGCGQFGHNRNSRMCPALRARPEARLVSEPGDDGSESDSDDDDTAAMAARAPPPPPRGLPRPIVVGAVGSELQRAATQAAAARAVRAAAAAAAAAGGTPARAPLAGAPGSAGRGAATAPAAATSPGALSGAAAPLTGEP